MHKPCTSSICASTEEASRRTRASTWRNATGIGSPGLQEHSNNPTIIAETHFYKALRDPLAQRFQNMHEVPGLASTWTGAKQATARAGSCDWRNMTNVVFQAQSQPQCHVKEDTSDYSKVLCKILLISPNLALFLPVSWSTAVCVPQLIAKMTKNECKYYIHITHIKLYADGQSAVATTQGPPPPVPAPKRLPPEPAPAMRPKHEPFCLETNWESYHCCFMDGWGHHHWIYLPQSLCINHALPPSVPAPKRPPPVFSFSLHLDERDMKRDNTFGNDLSKSSKTTHQRTIAQCILFLWVYQTSYFQYWVTSKTLPQQP